MNETTQSEAAPRGRPGVPGGPWLRVREDWAEAGEGSRRLFTFDLAGRLVEAFVGGVGYRRGLDNRVLERRPVRGADGLSRRQRRWLTREEARQLVDQAVETVRGAARAGYPALNVLDWAALEEDARRFRQVYRPIGILPPDQYLSVVLQLTAGCWYNRCTFCTFYRGQRFSVRSLDEFRRHMEEVRAFFGPGLLRRHTVFLGDANALVLATRRLTAYLEAVGEAFAGLEVFAFLDAFNGRRKTVAEWRDLAALGLRRVYIGLESGSDELLRFLEKPGTVADALATVQAMKAGGVGAGVILLLGAGGRLYAEEHVRRSVEVVNAMELGAGDLLYLSPLVAAPGSPYEERAREAGVVPLSPGELRAQAEALLEGVRLGRGARWSYYFVEEFLY